MLDKIRFAWSLSKSAEDELKFTLLVKNHSVAIASAIVGTQFNCVHAMVGMIKIITTFRIVETIRPMAKDIATALIHNSIVFMQCWGMI